MAVERESWITDRWGAQSDAPATQAQFASAFDELDPDDLEHSVVDISDEHDLFVEFSLRSVAFGNAETGDEEGAVELRDRAHALAIADEFIRGDFEALHRREWS